MVDNKSWMKAFFKNTYFQSIHFRISLFVSIAILLTGLASTYIIRDEVSDGLKEIIAEQQDSFSLRVSTEIDRNISERLTFIHSLSKKIARSKILDQAAINTILLDDFVVSSYFPDGIYVIDTKSEYRIIVGKQNLPNEDVFINFFTQLKKKNERMLSDAFMTESGVPIMLFGSPIVEEGYGSRLGYVIGAINPSRKEIVGDLMNVKTSGGGYAYIFEPVTRRLILHPDKRRMLNEVIEEGKNQVLDRGVRGFEGSAIGVNSKGVENLISIRKIRSTGWLLGVNYPVKNAFHPIHKLLEKLTFVLTVGAIFTILIVLLLSIRIARPLMDVSRNIQKAGDDLENAHLLPENSDYEIGYLTQSYNKLLLRFQEELKRRAEVEERLTFNIEAVTDITETMGDALVVTDSDEHISFINPKAKELLCTPDTSCQGKPLLDIIRFMKPLPDRRARKQINAPFNVDSEITIAGQRVELSCTVNPLLKSGDFQGWVVSFRDVSENRRYEREIMEAKAIAERANQAKSDFLAHVSHEIRTPMSAIIGITENILDSDLSEYQRELANMVSGQANDLLAIINDILSISKMESGTIAMSNKPFSVKLLVDDIFKGMELRASQKNISLSHQLDGPDWIVADPTRIRQVLVNLIGNAIKFTDHGSIKVILTVVDDSLLFEVRDTGIGIPEEKIDKIFEAFQQADDFIERQYGGTGLGLTICRKLVELSGGYIWVESTFRKGSSFFFTLPLVIPSENDIASAAPEHENSTGIAHDLSILLAEDNMVNRRFFEIVLCKAGHRLTLVENGEEAVDAVNSGKQFDLILMDIQMPRMNGLQAVAEIRKMGHKIPIVALSAHAMDGFSEEVKQGGFTDFLTKPISGAKLIDYLNKNFGNGTIKNNPETTKSGSFSLQKTKLDFGWTDDEFEGFISMLATHIESSMSDIEIAIQSESPSRLHEILHGLKSTLGTINASEAQALCILMDDAARNGDINVSVDNWKEFRKMLEIIYNETFNLQDGYH